MNMNINQYMGYGTGTPQSTYGSGNPIQSSSAYKLPNTSSAGDTGNSSSLVDLNSASQTLLMADDNLDGIVDKQELAMAAYQLLSNQNATEKDQTMGQMFATMVQGGADSTGLFPDLDGDGGLSHNELALLAKGDDDANTLSADDFKFAFGNKYTAGGNSISLDGLKAIATGNADTATANDNSTSADGQSNPQQDIKQSTVSLLEMIINYLKQQGVGTANSSTPTQQTPAAETPSASSSDQQPVTNQEGSQSGQQASPMTAIVFILGSIIKLMMGMMGGSQQQA